MIAPSSAVAYALNSSTTGSFQGNSYGAGVITNASMGNIQASGTTHINGAILEDFMKSVSERLLILTPDPAKLEKYEALRIAYNNYKLLESLLGSD